MFLTDISQKLLILLVLLYLCLFRGSTAEGHIEMSSIMGG
jgi:hypothetical protein